MQKGIDTSGITGFKIGIWICPVCDGWSMTEENKLGHKHWCRSCNAYLEVCYNSDPKTCRYYTYRYREVTDDERDDS